MYCRCRNRYGGKVIDGVNKRCRRTVPYRCTRPLLFVLEGGSDPASPDVLTILMEEYEITSSHLVKGIISAFWSPEELHCLHSSDRFRTIWIVIYVDS